MSFPYFHLNTDSAEGLKHELRRERMIAFVVLILAVVFSVVFYFFFKTPANFKPETVLTVSIGENLATIATHLKQEKVITSTFWFSNLVIAQGGERKIVAGDYIFHKPASVFEVARRFVKGDFELTPIKITIPEGSNTYDIASIISKHFTGFDTISFLEEAKSKEGYLFPDTYFFFATAKPAFVIDEMATNFTTQTQPLLAEIATSTHSLHDIITMASILEAEAKTTEDRKIVSGILWKRLSENMKLQIDSPFKYVNGKTSDELTVDDLKMNSPYNTYRYPGLPPTPISNPGLDAIDAALFPTSTPYYFFISDREGNMHYAITGAEHEKNVKKYLR